MHEGGHPLLLGDPPKKWSHHKPSKKKKIPININKKLIKQQKFSREKKKGKKKSRSPCHG